MIRENFPPRFSEYQKFEFRKNLVLQFMKGKSVAQIKT